MLQEREARCITAVLPGDEHVVGTLPRNRKRLPFAAAKVPKVTYETNWTRAHTRTFTDSTRKQAICSPGDG